MFLPPDFFVVPSRRWRGKASRSFDERPACGSQCRRAGQFMSTARSQGCSRLPCALRLMHKDAQPAQQASSMQPETSVDDNQNLFVALRNAFPADLNAIAIET